MTRMGFHPYVWCLECATAPCQTMMSFVSRQVGYLSIAWIEASATVPSLSDYGALDE